MPEYTKLSTVNLVMPEDLNPHGTLFGGKIMAEMDKFASIVASHVSQCKVVTRYVSEINFTNPIRSNEAYSIECERYVKGESSISIEVVVKRVPLLDDMVLMEVATRATFVFVAVNENGEKIKIDWDK